MATRHAPTDVGSGAASSSVRNAVTPEMMRRRAVSVGTAAAPSTQFGVPFAAGASSPSATLPYLVAGNGHSSSSPATNSAATAAASAAATAGGAISTKHSSRVIAVINLDALQEVGVDLQALYDIFQHFGAVRSLDPVAAVPEQSPSGQSPLNISLMPMQRAQPFSNGIALISFYDLRHAQKAMTGLNGKIIPSLNARGGEPLSLQLQYFVLRDFPGASLPMTSGPASIGSSATGPALFSQYQNQGTLVIFNLDPSVTNEELRDIFSQHGEVKEIRESPNKKHKFVEFFDVRCADKAMRSLNKTDIKGRKIKIEPSRPGGTQARKSPPIAVPSAAGGLSATFPSASLSLQPENGAFGHSRGPVAATPEVSNHFDLLSDASSDALMQSLSDLVLLHQQTAAEEVVSDEPVLRAQPLSGFGSSPLLLSSHLYPPIDANGTSATSVLESPESQEGERAAADVAIPSLRLPLPPVMEEPEHDKPVAIALSRPLAAARRSHRSSSMPPKVVAPTSPLPLPSAPTSPSPPPLGATSSSAKTRKRASSQSVPATDAPSSAGNSSVGSPGGSVSSSPISSPGNSARGSGSSLRPPNSPVSGSARGRHPRGMANKISGFIRRERSSSEGSQRLAALRGVSGPSADVLESDRGGSGKPLFDLDLDRVRRCEDLRTTLMVKNIPNKYDQDMLLLAVNRAHAGLYDFFYLPIDFKNKCNVGYAFINFIDPQSICAFFDEFNNKKWERFNSEKVCQITYARIQGKNSMVEHFKNSSLMFEDPKCRPLLFFSEGDLAGTAEPFPVSGGRPRTSRRESVGSSNSSEPREVRSVDALDP